MALFQLLPRSLINTDDHQAVVDLRLKDGKGSILKIFIGARVQGWSGGEYQFYQGRLGTGRLCLGMSWTPFEISHTLIHFFLRSK